MEARSVAEDTQRRGDSTRWRLWALVPILLLVGIVALFSARGGSVLELVGQSPPPADEFDIRRVELSPGEVRIRVTNPQREDLTIATVTVDDAIVPFTVEGDDTLGRLRSSTIVVPYDWVEEEPLMIVGADGSQLIDSEGRRYIDGVSSLWCNVHGHRHPGDEAGAVRAEE